MPNEAGIGEFIPQRVGTQSVTFQDVLVNVNFADYQGYSSIENSTDAGGTISTYTRLGQRWLNCDPTPQDLVMNGVGYFLDGCCASKSCSRLPDQVTPEIIQPSFPR